MDKFKELKEREKEIKEKYGYVIHYVPDYYDENKYYINAHTHGLLEKYNHLELEIVINVQYDTTCTIINSIVNNYISKGIILTEDSELTDILKNGYSIRFKEIVNDSNEKLLRIIFPDEYKLFPDDINCSPIFKFQTEIGVKRD